MLTIRKKQKQKIFSIIIIAIIMFFTAFYSMKLGSINFATKEIIKLLDIQNGNSINAQIVKNIRIPRILTGILAGMNLATAGVLLQGILKNPMASPNIIGINSGAGLTAIILMIFFPLNIEILSFSAFMGALFTSLLIYSISYLSGNKNLNLILSGVAVSSLFSSLTSGVMILNSDELNITYNWLIGSFSGKSWSDFNSIFYYSIIGISFAIYISPKLNLFALGDEMAETMGVSVKKYKLLSIITASALAGSAVSVAGTLGFVGLICPHIGRILVGNNHKSLIPISALLGGVLISAADTIARTMFSPYELPVGIIISLLGAPFFLYLLFSKNKNLNK
jgi:iron complex transport system permease protein